MLNYKLYSDVELVDLLCTDDERILIEIYDRYWDRLLAVGFNRLGNLEEAEECVQDVLYKLWKLRKTFTLQRQTLSSYLARAIRNQSFNMLEKRYRMRASSSELHHEDVVDTMSPERQLIVRELEQQLDSAIKELPAQCQLVFVLNKHEGLSTKEIAEQLHISENTVKSHLKKAKRNLGNHTGFLTTLVLLHIYLQRM